MKNLESAATDGADVSSCKNLSGGGQTWIYAGVHHRNYSYDERCTLTGRARNHLELLSVNDTFDGWS